MIKGESSFSAHSGPPKGRDSGNLNETWEEEIPENEARESEDSLQRNSETVVKEQLSEHLLEGPPH